jgi:putative Flp pilus-assembly TadE/G-like protein
MLKRFQRFRDDERGMSFVFVGIGFMAFMAATTLAIDVGMFMTARTQAQTSADAAALSGATALVYNSWSDRNATGPAVQSALSTAQQNNVMGSTVSVLPTDVTFPLDAYGQANEVKVDVFRTVSRENAVPTLIGRLFGIDKIDIQATATAQAAPASGMTCVKPFIIPDKWIENRNPPWTTSSTFDKYDNHGNLLTPNYDDYDPTKGYSYDDRGTELVLRAQQGNNIEPSMYYSWKMPGDIGGDFYQENIANCNTSVIEVGDIAQQEPGAKEGPTLSGLQTLYDKDPGAYWDSTLVGGLGDYVSTQRPSPRVFPIPLYNPDEYQKAKQEGRVATLKVTRFIGFFLTDITGGEARGRIFPITGVSAISGPTTTPPLAYVIRLVK